MIENIFRPMYQKYCVDPIANKFSQYENISPATITIAALCSGILCGYLIALSQTILACLCLLFSGYCDTLDGTLARHKNISSQQGTVLDIVVDRVVKFAIIFGLFCVAPQSRSIASMWMLGSTLICVTSFLVVGIFTENAGKKAFH